MNYFLKDVIEIYPLKNYVEFPEMSDYLTAEFITQLEKTNFYNEDKILKRIERKYQYNEIGTSDVSQFYDYLNQLIEENFSKYLMDLITISDTYSIQNMDTQDLEVTHTVISEGENLIISNDTPSNKLNIANIKAGESASNVQYTTDKGHEYKDITHRESTSALNTTQSNIENQLKINKQVQDALNSFVDSLKPAFSIVMEEYYE